MQPALWPTGCSFKIVPPQGLDGESAHRRCKAPGKEEVESRLHRVRSLFKAGRPERDGFPIIGSLDFARPLLSGTRSGREGNAVTRLAAILDPPAAPPPSRGIRGPNTPPCGTSREKPSRATRAPKAFPAPFRWIIAAPGGGWMMAGPLPPRARRQSPRVWRCLAPNFRLEFQI